MNLPVYENRLVFDLERDRLIKPVWDLWSTRKLRRKAKGQILNIWYRDDFKLWKVHCDDTDLTTYFRNRISNDMYLYNMEFHCTILYVRHWILLNLYPSHTVDYWIYPAQSHVNKFGFFYNIECANRYTGNKNIPEDYLSKHLHGKKFKFNNMSEIKLFMNKHLLNLKYEFEDFDFDIKKIPDLKYL